MIVKYKKRIILRKAAISSLNGILWYRRITEGNKSNIFKTIVRSIVIYGAETWHLKYKANSQFNSNENGFLEICFNF